MACLSDLARVPWGPTSSGAKKDSAVWSGDSSAKEALYPVVVGKERSALGNRGPRRADAWPFRATAITVHRVTSGAKNEASRRYGNGWIDRRCGGGRWGAPLLAEDGVDRRAKGNVDDASERIRTEEGSFPINVV